MANPHERRCLAKYEARDARKGMRWTVVLPRQCWNCGTTEDLTPQRFDAEIKVYHQPVMIVSVTIAFVVLILLTTFCLSVWLPGILAVGIVIAGAWILLKLKSWQEEARLHVWSCRQHGDMLEQPDMIVEDESLNIFLPTPEICRAAMADLKERRRQGGKRRDQPGAGQASSAPASPNQPASSDPPRVPHRPSAPREDLPPIKLVGDDDSELLVDPEPETPPQSSSSLKPPSSQAPRSTEAPPGSQQNREEDRPWFEQ
ncbi:MAG: hypothetical protein MPJ50_03590 [Pirellulales bacterium]|nr:hypothetical protein [Pirellulales bacterium]